MHRLRPYIWRGATAAAEAGGASNTLVLCHYEGSDTATTISDEMAGITHTFANGAEIDTAVAKFGSSSLLLDAITAEDVATGFTFDNTQPWTLEAFHYSSDTNQVYIGLYDGSDNICARLNINHDLTSTSSLLFDTESNIITNSAGGSPGAWDTWHHIAVCYNGSNYYWFYDGTRKETTASAALLRVPTKLRVVCTTAYVAATLNNLDEVRLSQVARYADAATCTVPTSAFEAD